MTMVSTGPISLGGNATSGGLNQSVNIELGRAATDSINMNESAVRTLAGVPSGAISMSNFYGKSNAFTFSFAGGTDVNLRNAAISAGWNQSSALQATNTGTIQSSSTGTPALTISGSFPGGVSFINNSVIYGRGGNGGAGASWNGITVVGGSNGASGGTALSVSSPVSITNNGTIGGGGGGGGGGQGGWGTSGMAVYFSAGGGGGGGGIGVSSGGAGGTRVNVAGGSNGSPGSGGTISTTGSGGGGGSASPFGVGGNGGGGGGYGSSGSTGGSATTPNRSPTYGGGASGSAIVGNSNITWVATGTRLGPIN